MTRTFHAIAEGTFYTDKFENAFTIVYDCGAKFIGEIKDKTESVQLSYDQNTQVVQNVRLEYMVENSYPEYLI